MDPASTPEFYTGAPVDSDDLRFREAFVAELWETLAVTHVLLTAPRRTGKTSVMDHLKHFPADDFTVVSVNAQDLSHPAELFQAILDTFLDHHPKFFRDKLASGWELVKGTLDRIDDVGAGGFKIGLRESDPNWRDNWRRHGTDFLQQIRGHEERVLLVIDELPDMLLNMQKEHEPLLREFLALVANPAAGTTSEKRCRALADWRFGESERDTRFAGYGRPHQRPGKCPVARPDRSTSHRVRPRNAGRAAGGV